MGLVAGEVIDEEVAFDDLAIAGADLAAADEGGASGVVDFEGEALVLEVGGDFLAVPVVGVGAVATLAADEDGAVDEGATTFGSR